MTFASSINSRFLTLTFQLLVEILLLSLSQQLTNIPESTQQLSLDCPVPRDRLCNEIEWRVKVLCDNNNDDDDDTSILRLSCHNTQQQQQHHVILVQYINSSTSSPEQQQHCNVNKNQLSHSSTTGKSCFSSAEIFRACHQRVSCHVTSSSELIGRPLCSHSIQYACVSVKTLRDLKSTANCSRHSVTSLCAAFNAKRDRRQVLATDDVTPATSRRRPRRKTTVTAAVTTAVDDVTTDDVVHDVITQSAPDHIDQLEVEPEVTDSATEAIAKTTTAVTTTTIFPFVINIVQNVSTAATATATASSTSTSNNNNYMDPGKHEHTDSDVAVEWFWTAIFIKGHCQMLILYGVLGIAFGLICLLLFVIIRIGCCRPRSSVRYTPAPNNSSSIHRSSYSSPSSPSTDKGIATPSTMSTQTSPGGKRSGSPVWACDDDTGARLAKSGSPRGNGWTVGPEIPRTDAEIDRVQFGVWGTAPGQSASLGRPYNNPYRHDSYRVDGMKTLQLR